VNGAARIFAALLWLLVLGWLISRVVDEIRAEPGAAYSYAFIFLIAILMIAIMMIVGRSPTKREYVRSHARKFVATGIIVVVAATTAFAAFAYWLVCSNNGPSEVVMEVAVLAWIGAILIGATIALLPKFLEGKI
jgi:hypothetical protein